MFRLNDIDWHDQAECRKLEHKKLKPFFFSNVHSERYDAKNLCFTCPVRKECLQWALDNKQIWGVWGGKDEAEIRRALSVSHTGQEIRRQRFPNCPYCGARPIKLSVETRDDPDGGRWTTMKIVICSECSFEWKSRTSANAVTAYHAAKKAKEEKLKSKKTTS